ncbi:MAG TPA: hypothetical protein VFM36_10545 [Thermoanaerobaculia bacterium]|nr:hypothetical protein [Thermoanaerobaculia bacterium]
MRRLLTILLLAVAMRTGAEERSLVWKSLDVTAKIDSNGIMKVSERHRMLFNGAWNGGERKFRVAPGQIFQFERITWIYPDTGAGIPLIAAVGSVPLHHYVLSGNTLRWRAREETDPPFDNRELTYVIDYVLMNVIVKEGEGYSLEHDFAFAERNGVIEAYSLDLEFDPAWKLPEGFETHIERDMIPPGESLIVDIPLGWTGQGQPAYLGVDSAVYAAQQIEEEEAPAPPSPPPVPMPVRMGALGVFFLILLALRLWFVKREEGVGRYATPEVNRLWIERTLLPIKPEVVGTAWDDSTGQPEVAALIARMAIEKKLENHPGQTPRLKLLVPRESLEGYEREFVDRLFVSGDEITPAEVKKVYAATGFNPEEPLRRPLGDAAAKIVGASKFVSGCAAVVVGAIVIAVTAPGPFAKIAGVVAFLFSVALAGIYRTQLGGRTSAAFLPLPLALFGIIVAIMAASDLSLAITLLATLFLVNIVLYIGAWTASPDELSMLKGLRAARDYFKNLLERKEEIEERWIPYILAFGLGDQLDRWSVEAPVPVDEERVRRDRPRASMSIPTATSSAPSVPTFKAGGGSFGGAGATGGWAKSVGSFAAAVPKPAPPRSSGSSSSGWSSSSSSSSSRSSSSSGSSRSSGGSRSGGGGGGGW